MDADHLFEQAERVREFGAALSCAWLREVFEDVAAECEGEAMMLTMPLAKAA